jgi:phage/plasmid-like protein (TIGR03299 family)
MAHLIDQTTGQAAFAYFREPAWHKLGTPLTEQSSTNLRLAMEQAHVVGEIEYQKTYLANGQENPFSQAVVRLDTGEVICSVGPETVPIQNADALSILEPLIDYHGARIDTIGSLKNGAHIFAAVSLPKRIEVADGDMQDGYMLVHLEHSNIGSLEVIPTMVRVVCNNTMQMMLGRANGSSLIRVKKNAMASQRIQQATALVDRFVSAMEQTQVELREMARRTLNEDEVKQFIEEVFPQPSLEKTSKLMEARQQTVRQQVYSSPGAELAGANPFTGEASLWAVLNGISSYTDHVRAQEAKSERGQARAYRSAMFGTLNAAKLLALSKARQLVEVR